MLSKLRHDGPLSHFAYNFNMRRYAKEAAVRSAGALAALSPDTHLELMEAGARAPLVAACGAEVLDALTAYIRRHADPPSGTTRKEPYESLGSAVDEMLALCAAAGSPEVGWCRLNR
jgi:hypothetical protein